MNFKNVLFFCLFSEKIQSQYFETGLGFLPLQWIGSLCFFNRYL
jgi:hypothetical protein